MFKFSSFFLANSTIEQRKCKCHEKLLFSKEEFNEQVSQRIKFLPIDSVVLEWVRFIKEVLKSKNLRDFLKPCSESEFFFGLSECIDKFPTLIWLCINYISYTQMIVSSSLRKSEKVLFLMVFLVNFDKHIFVKHGLKENFNPTAICFKKVIFC